MKQAANGGREISVLICRGDLNAASMVRIKNTLSRLLHRNRKRMILDLAKARRADFSGLGILMDRIQKIRAMRGDIRIINMRPEVSQTFDKAGVNRLVETFPSKHDALRSYQLAS